MRFVHGIESLSPATYHEQNSIMTELKQLNDDDLQRIGFAFVQEVTSALVDELQVRYRSIQIIRNGALQVTLFRPTDYTHAQIVVGIKGVHVVFNPTKEATDEEASKNIRGPFPLEDPNMFNYLHSIIDLWLQQP